MTTNNKLLDLSQYLPVTGVTVDEPFDAERAHQLERAHQPDAAHLADQRMVGKATQGLLQKRPDPADMAEDVALLVDVQRLQRDGGAVGHLAGGGGVAHIGETGEVATHVLASR